jgi:HlyD family secretion protein
MLLASACQPPPTPSWSGYLEGDYVYIAAPIAGTLNRLQVQAGELVERGAPLFELDASNESAARAQAEALLGSAQAQVANIAKGRRDDELAVTRAQLAQAQARQALAQVELRRQQDLFAQGFIAPARLDDARTALTQADARVAELRAALRVARLPARRDERSAASAQAEAASQVVSQTRWREQQKQQTAPVAARVSETYFRQGEWVPAGQPVLALLPAGAVKARFFVPETEIATLAPGQAVTLHCDGCGAPIAARITLLASEAEYTPPVIYSNAQRAKLVFRVEARPALADAARLRPGQPIEVRAVAAAAARASR